VHKKLAACAVIGTIIMLFSLQVMAFDRIQTIRVGLESRYKEVTSVPISDNEIEIGFQDNNEFEGKVKLDGTFSVSLPSGTIINANEYYPSYDDAVSACEDLENLWKYKAVPGMVDKDLWGIFVYDYGGDKADYAADTVTGSLVNDKKIMVLNDNDKIKMVFDGVNPQIMSAENYTTLSGKSYRGVIEFGRYTGKNITAVNVVNMQDYLYSVVPSEMPPSWNIEALKAQAVAARTYVYTRKSVYESKGYDVCDTTECQAYNGVSAESDRSTEAVNDTEGELALYEGEPIYSVFFSSSGGSTDDSENVWDDSYPYLKAVNDKYEKGAVEWKRTFSASDMTNFMNKINKSVGTVKNVSISSAGPYGRVQELTVVGSNKTVKLTKEETRTFCASSGNGSLQSRMYTISNDDNTGDNENNNNKNTDDNDSNNTDKNKDTVYIISDKNISLADVKNGYFKAGGTPIKGFELDGIKVIVSEEDIKDLSQNSVKKVTALSSNSQNEFVFSGKGCGHGVGMSQYGAKGMAENGFDFKEILKYYYTGIEVE
jgi:stage II sporulation protein D